MAAETPDSIYECACLPWPTDNRTLLNDMNLCSTCLVDHGQPADAIGLKADTSAWDKFCSSNTASNVTTDAILALLQEAPFFPALNQLEASATSAYRYLTTGIVGTLTMAAASVTVTPATIAMSGWETMVMEPPPTTSSTTEYTASSTVADTMGTEFTETLLIVTTISEYPLPSGTSANSPTTPRISASATATGGAVTLVCIGRMGMLALVMFGVLTAIIPVM
ncbi:MAG: hypothetical protein M1830_004136 [Pleopsidium flavum]|nr:MAG: hypothetical protein M1830_004136 [Pleopsidium flavum]